MKIYIIFLLYWSNCGCVSGRSNFLIQGGPQGTFSSCRWIIKIQTFPRLTCGKYTLQKHNTSLFIFNVLEWRKSPACSCFVWFVGCLQTTNCGRSESQLEKSRESDTRWCCNEIRKKQCNTWLFKELFES